MLYQTKKKIKIQSFEDCIINWQFLFVTIDEFNDEDDDVDKSGDDKGELVESEKFLLKPFVDRLI